MILSYLIAPNFFPVTFPSCVLEVSKDEVDEYYSPKDFQVGQTVTLLGRRFLLYDCDGFTKEYFQRNHPDIEIKPTEVPEKVDTLQGKKMVRNKIVFSILLLFYFQTKVYYLRHISHLPPSYISNVCVNRRFLTTMVLVHLKTLFRIVCL